MGIAVAGEACGLQTIAARGVVAGGALDGAVAALEGEAALFEVLRGGHLGHVGEAGGLVAAGAVGAELAAVARGVAGGAGDRLGDGGEAFLIGAVAVGAGVAGVGAGEGEAELRLVVEARRVVPRLFAVALVAGVAEGAAVGIDVAGGALLRDADEGAGEVALAQASLVCAKRNGYANLACSSTPMVEGVHLVEVWQSLQRQPGGVWPAPSLGARRACLAGVGSDGSSLFDLLN